jgi:hypothetical protein
MRFALALHTDDGVKHGVTVPDLPGCFSAGDSFDEAVEMGPGGNRRAVYPWPAPQGRVVQSPK